jgi:hypothetical protein
VNVVLLLSLVLVTDVLVAVVALVSLALVVKVMLVIVMLVDVAVTVVMVAVTTESFGTSISNAAAVILMPLDRNCD